jgi:serine/threonine-protein phosphatase 2A regulatory subunit A
VNPSDFESDLMEILNKLALSEYINHKQSSIQLISLIFKNLNMVNKNTALGYLIKFSNEESPMLKKELANSLKNISIYIDDELFKNLITSFIQDTNDTVRIPIMENIVSLKSHSNLSSLQGFIINTITQLSNDESWRVRLTVGDKIHEIFSFASVSPQLKAAVVDIFVKLLDDSESETRNCCCLKLESIAEKLGKDDSIDRILLQLKKLEKDPASYVRGAVASGLLRICPLIGKQKTNDFIFPVFLNMIKDENHDIRMTLIKTLDSLHEVINIDHFVQSIIPSIIEISANKSWRIRIQVSESVPVVARILVREI